MHADDAVRALRRREPAGDAEQRAGEPVELGQFVGVGEGPLLEHPRSHTPALEVAGIVEPPVDLGTGLAQRGVLGRLPGGQPAVGVEGQLAAAEALSQRQQQGADLLLARSSHGAPRSIAITPCTPT